MNEYYEKLELVNGLVDGEVSEAERIEAVRLIQAETHLSLEYSSIQALKRKLNEQPYMEVPTKGWADCQSRIRDIERSKTVERFVSKYAWGICGIVFVSIIGGSALNRMNLGHQFGTSDVPQAMSGLSADPSFSPNSFGTWLKSKLGSAPMERPASIKIIQGVSGEINNRPAVRLTLSDRTGFLSLFILSGSNAIRGVQPIIPGSSFSEGSVGDLNCVTWSDNGYDMMLVGPRSDHQLYSMAKLICPNKQ